MIALAIAERGLHVLAILTERASVGATSLLTPDAAAVTMQKSVLAFKRLTLTFAKLGRLVLPVPAVLEVVAVVLLPDAP